MQVGIRVVSDRNDSMNPGVWRPLKLVRFDRLSNLRTDSARDDLRLGGAVAIGQGNLLGKKIEDQTFGAESVRPTVKLRVSQEQETVAELERGLEPVHLFAAKSEVCRRDKPGKADTLLVVPASPKLPIQMRWLSEAEEIELALLIRLEQRAHDSAVNG